jgi:hypothetical protein
LTNEDNFIPLIERKKFKCPLCSRIIELGLLSNHLELEHRVGNIENVDIVKRIYSAFQDGDKK